MPTVLRKLASLSPWRLLGTFWATLVVLSLLALVPALEGIATAAGFAFFVGYPYAVILGFQPGVIRTSIRAVARWLLLGFALILLIMTVFIPFLPEGYSTPTNPTSTREWLELILGIAACVVVFSPFFLGAAALNDLRRHLRQDSTMGSIPHFLALYFWPAGGVLYAHRKVRDVLHAA